MLTDQELNRFIEDGVVTVDTPFTDRQIAEASAAFDRLMPFQAPAPGQAPRHRVAVTRYDDPVLLDILQHPFFEAVSRQALRAEAVHFFQTYLITSYPQPGVPFSFDQHVDIQYGLDDLRAEPRRMLCSFFLWINGVNERRAPLMLRPRSHWLIAENRERDPSLRGSAPRVAGVKLAQLPPLPYADPTPIVARAGQVSVATTATIHGASVNVDTEPRKAFLTTFVAEGVEIELPENQAAAKREYDPELRRHLRPDRAHIVAA
ncbi:MAG: hypothetical protein EXS64_17105 [Candidatus Latescibacteria bacterium]|nr:hypothetical protein [Candidatus Latescibacterota bacterium]